MTHHTPETLKQAIASAVSARVSSLKNLSLSELAALPGQSSEQLTIHDNRVTMAIWHDAIGRNDHRIVVQAYKPGILVGRMHADGFVISQSGAIRPLSQDEWSEFS